MSFDITYKLAQLCTTRRMQAKSYAEYTARVAQRWADLMGAMSEAASAEPPSLSRTASRNDRNSSVTSAVSEILRKYNFSDQAVLCLNDGSIPLTSLLQTSINYSYDIEEWSGETPMPDVDAVTISTDSGKMYSLASLGQELQATYHAICTDMAIMEGFSISEKPSEIIAVARDRLSGIFADGFLDISNTLESKLGFIKSGAAITDFVRLILDKSGINAVSDGVAVDFSQSDDVAFTGASPASAYCWDTLGEAISSGAQMACTAVKTAFSWLTDKASALFHKVETKVREIVADPYDIELVNETNPDANDFVDGWFIQVPFEYVVSDLTATDAAMADKLANSLSNKAVKFDFTFGTFLFQLSTVSATLSHGLITSGTLQVKPKPVDWTASAINLLGTHRLSTRTLPHEGVATRFAVRELRLDYIEDAIWGSCSASSLSLLTVSSDERTLLRGFLFGRFLCRWAITCMALESAGVAIASTWSADAFYELDACINAGNDTGPFIGSRKVTNQDFYLAATNAKVLTYSEANIDCWGDSATGYPVNNAEFSYESRSQAWVPAVTMFLNSQIDEEKHPLNFDWLPYTSNGVSWEQGKYRIRTDQDNISRFNNFVTTAVIIAGVVAITIASIIILKKASTKAFLKLQGAMWTCTDEASTGSLSKASIKAYKKANLKSKLLSALSGGLKTAASAGAASGMQSFQNPLLSRSDVSSDIDTSADEVMRTILGRIG